MAFSFLTWPIKRGEHHFGDRDKAKYSIDIWHPDATHHSPNRKLYEVFANAIRRQKLISRTKSDVNDCATDQIASKFASDKHKGMSDV